MWFKAFQCVGGGCRQTKLCLQASSQKEKKKHCSTMWLTRTGSDDDIGLVWLFTKHSLIILQAVLPRRADPTELKAIFEKVGFDLYVLFSFLSLPSIKEGFLPSFDLGFFSFFYEFLSLVSLFLSFYKKKCSVLQYASVKKNEEYFMSAQDFVSRFLYVHTDILLTNEATNLLAGVVDQKKDGSVYHLSFRQWKFHICRVL